MGADQTTDDAPGSEEQAAAKLSLSSPARSQAISMHSMAC